MRGKGHEPPLTVLAEDELPVLADPVDSDDPLLVDDDEDGVGVAVVVDDVTDDVEAALVAEVPALVWYAATPSAATAAVADDAEGCRELSAQAERAIALGHGDASLRGGHHRTSCGWTAWALPAASELSLAPHAKHAAQVGEHGSRNVHARIRVLDPLDGDLVDAEAVPLCDHEQLGVEEPSLIADRGQQVTARPGHGWP